MTGNRTKPMETPLEDFGRHRCVEAVQSLLKRVRSGTSDYYNKCPVIQITDRFEGENGISKYFAFDFDVKDVCVLAMILQAPLSLKGATDKAKTFLAERVLASVFGNHGTGWWRTEINKGMGIDDLIDIDLKTLSESKLSQAISAAEWLSFPARLIDEYNRAHAKLNNVLIHLIDGSGFNVRGDLNIPVGMPYRVAGEERRYSFTICTANEGYEGTFDQDPALVRRIILSLNLDEVAPTTQDVSQMLSNRRVKTTIRQTEWSVKDVVSVYEALPKVVPYSGLGHLFLHYLSGSGTCIRTRCGRQRPSIKADLCPKCHLAKAHRFCGNIGGISEGLLLWCKEIATGIAVIRAAKVLEQIEEESRDPRNELELQEIVGESLAGQDLFNVFREKYLQNLFVEGEDVVAAYSLVAPNHVWIDENWLSSQPEFERKTEYALSDFARAGWESMRRFLIEKETLFTELSRNHFVSPAQEGEIEQMVTMRDAAMLSVVSAVRGADMDLRLRGRVLPRKAA